MNYQKLSYLFADDPKNAIIESQKLICSVTEFPSYEEFDEYHTKNAHISTCPNEWSTSQLCVYCRDCAAIHPACVCLQCFLNGNHDGHNYVVLNSSGNCDCGDLSQWKPSGCCPEHRGLSDEENKPEEYLDEKLRAILVDVIFKSAFASLPYFSKSSSENASLIIQFVSSFLKYGDGFRRLIAKSLTEKIDLESLLIKIPSYSKLFNESLQGLCGVLVNDQLFIRNFSRIGLNVISKGIINHIHKFLSSGSKNISYGSWDSFWFHIFSEKNVKYSIEHDKWDWVEFFTECLEYHKDLFDFIKDSSYKHMPELLINLSSNLSNATKFQPNEQTQLMLDNLVTKILSCGSKKSINEGKKDNNTIIVTSFNEKSERFDYFPVFHFIACFYDLYRSFKNKPNLKFETLIDELDKTFDISSIFKMDDSLENNKFIKSIYNQKSNGTFPQNYYNSFHNGGSFFLSHPLLHSLVSLFRNDNTTRIKIANLLSKEKYQDLRIRIGIAVLKSILSNVCYRQFLVSLENRGVNFVYNLLSKPDSASNYSTKFIPVFQLIIGLQGEKRSENDEFSLKEFFAFEIAREIGFFDDFTSVDYKSEKINEIQKQMIFSFLYMSLLFVIERTLFNFNGNDFIQEQIIFELKKGVHSIDALDQLYDKEAIEIWSSLWIFNYILMKIATSNKMEENKEENCTSFNKDVSFYLKDGVEWNPISAINLINDQMTLMNDEISKNSDNLIKIQNFIDEEKYFFHPRKMCKDEILDYDNKEEEEVSDVPMIHLKEFLFTPTVLAIVYHTLRTNTGIDSPNSDINDHLAMNILVLISRFVKENNKEEIKNSLNESMTIHYDFLIDLISKLKKDVFNFNDSIIENNILNQKNFVSLMKLKISSKDLQPKSFIDVLLSKGKLGRNALNEISKNVHLDCIEIGEQKQENIKEINHQRAKKIKEDIMNHYKTMISNYNVSDEISSISQSGPATNDNEVCSICSMYKQNEIFSYPIYIYRTKFPFIIDKPPLISKDAEGISIDDNIEDFDRVNDNEEEEEEDFNQILPNTIISTLMNQFPQLANTEGLSEEDIEERQNTLSILFNQLLNQQIENLKQRKRRKDFIKEANQLQKKEEVINKEQNKNNDFKRCTAGVNFVLQFGICQHPIHLSCIKSNDFTCPIDRSRKNGFLPSVDGIPQSIIFKNLNSYKPEMDEKEGTIEHNIISAILTFIKNCESFFKCTNRPSVDIFIELIKSLSGLISTYEIRLRNLPDCLDSQKTKILARNLFLTVWYGYRIQKKPKMVLYENKEEDCETRMSTFQRFIKRLIECDEIEENFSNIVSFFVDSINKNSKNNGDRKEKELCLFLRRVCLAEYFLLNKVVTDTNDSEIIDWDDILSSQNLSTKYKVKFENLEEFEFKPFTFIDLPKQFLRFAAPPFNFHIEKMEELSFFNLIDYNYLINNYDELTGQISHMNFEDELKRNSMNLSSCDEDLIEIFLESFFSTRHQPSVILFVNKYASQIFLIDQGYFANLSPFYLDKYGCPDIGYKRSQPLFLNEEKYEKFIDTVLSRDFSYSLINLSALE